MKKLLIFSILLGYSIFGMAQSFDMYFTERTLRIDCRLSGNARQQWVAIDELSSLPQWAGRRNHLAEVPLRGNGEIKLIDATDSIVIYRNTFSTLFQEWLTTDEAQQVTRSYENTFLTPMPKHKAVAQIELYNSRGEVTARLAHPIDPTDILIKQKGINHITPHTYLQKEGDISQCIDVAILAEGYTEAEMDIFLEDARRACKSIFSHEPFKSQKDKFNVVAVKSISADSGVSIPRLHEWRQTAIDSHFSTFYSDRYLTTSKVKQIHDLTAGIPYEHIIILANTDEYGGGGIYNSYTLTTAHHAQFEPVVVHEFGHSFGGLGDEYFYEEDVMTDTYPLDVEPWEQNLTTQVEFEKKWKDMLPAGIKIPTSTSEAVKYPIGVYEGGGYSFKGIYRPADDCRMRTNTCPSFCPVCQRALLRIIQFHTSQ